MVDHTIILAAPGLFLMGVDGRPGQPIVAWACTGSQAFPITPFARAAITAGEGVWMGGDEGDGLLYDLVWKKVFPSVQAWRDAAEIEKPYQIGTVPGANAPLNGKPLALTPTEPNDFLHAKTYERKSYWQASGTHPYLIEIEPGQLTPRPGKAEKITREKFTELKNGGMVVVAYEAVAAPPKVKPEDDLGPIDPHAEANGYDEDDNFEETDPVSPEERDPPEESRGLDELGGEPVAFDADDDADDLI